MPLVTAVLSLLLFANQAMACSMCFYGNPKQTELVALRSSVIFLLTTVITVLLFFAKFFLNVRKRAKLMSN